MNFTRAASFSERNSRIVKSWFGGKDFVCIDDGVCYGKNWGQMDMVVKRKEDLIVATYNT